jgi:hypothetical protein
VPERFAAQSLPSEGRGHRFESCRVRQIFTLKNKAGDETAAILPKRTFGSSAHQVAMVEIGLSACPQNPVADVRLL